jgi:hypothetical protein
MLNTASAMKQSMPPPPSSSSASMSSSMSHATAQAMFSSVAYDPATKKTLVFAALIVIVIVVSTVAQKSLAAVYTFLKLLPALIIWELVIKDFLLLLVQMSAFFVTGFQPEVPATGGGWWG